MNLFPGELPVYEPIRPGDDAWAMVSCREEEGRLLVTTDLRYRGETATAFHTAALSGTDYDREGQRRHAVGSCFFQAYRARTGNTPPWGMLTGVRPDKLVTEALAEGKTPAAARRLLEEAYFVTPRRAALALETGTAAFEAAKGLGPRDIAVYIGVPFCPTRCAPLCVLFFCQPVGGEELFPGRPICGCPDGGDRVRGPHGPRGKPEGPGHVYGRWHAYHPDRPPAGPGALRF